MAGSDLAPGQNKVIFILVGVGYYAKGDALRTDRNELCKPRNLRGPVHDVEGIHRYIQEHPELQGATVFKLTSTRSEFAGKGKETKAVEAEDKLPTRANILSAFNELAELVREAGTCVVHVHFSCHAVRLATTYESLKGPSGLDEAIVPYDARRTGEVIRDVELNILIWKLSQLGARVSVIFDCCHAGSVCRGDDDESDSDDDFDTSRSAAGKTSDTQLAENDGEETYPMPPAADADGQETDSLPLDSRELAEALKEAWATRKDHWMMLPIDCDMFCSCYEDEKSYEMEVTDSGGKKVFRGVYTGTLLQALDELKEARNNAKDALPGLQPPVPILGQLHDRVVAVFQRENRKKQTPVFVGNRKRHWLQTTEGHDVKTVPIVDKGLGGITLFEGSMQGVTKGSIYTVVPWFQLSRVSSACASTGPRVEISNLSPATSYAKWLDKPSDDFAHQDLVAVLVKHKIDKMTVQLHHPPDPGSNDITLQYDRLERYADDEKEHDFATLEIVKEGGQDIGASYCIRVDQDRNFRLFTTDGPDAKPVACFPSTTEAGSFYGYLVHLAKYEMLKKLFNPFPEAALRDCVDLQFNGRDLTSFCVWDGSHIEDEKEDCFNIAAGSSVELVVRNRTGFPLFVALFVFDPQFGVKMYNRADGYILVPAHQDKRITLQVSRLPDQWDPAVDYIDYVKVFVWDKSQLPLASLRSVEMGSIGDDPTVGSRSLVDELDDVLRMLGAEDRGFVDPPQDTLSKGSPWMALTFRLRTLPQGP